MRRTIRRCKRLMRTKKRVNAQVMRKKQFPQSLNQSKRLSLKVMKRRRIESIDTGVGQGTDTKTRREKRKKTRKIMS